MTQLENGVGMLRLLTSLGGHGLMEPEEMAGPPLFHCHRRVRRPFLKEMIDMARKKCGK